MASIKILCVPKMFMMKLLTIFFLSSECMSKTVPAVFVFGDSFVDSGNNNYLLTVAKANFMPNGVDFGGPTGRFVNGRTSIDILGQLIGLVEFIPPYMAPTTTGAKILKGVNYASGCSGILSPTGKTTGLILDLDTQLDNFANTRQDIIKAIGAAAAQDLFRNAFYTVTTGSNDFLINYLAPIISKAEQILVPPEIFISTMIKGIRTHLTRLYSMGARKIMVTNLPPVGCTPYMIDTKPGADAVGTECYDYANRLASSYNTKLKSLISELNNEFEGPAFVYGNSYGILSDILQNHTAYGFEKVYRACCALGGKHGGLVPCTPLSAVCPDRSKYFFWDPFHLSDAVNNILANHLFDGGIEDVWPMNVRQLMN